MLKICNNGHVTGYRNCSWCGSESGEALARPPQGRARVDALQEMRAVSGLRRSGLR